MRDRGREESPGRNHWTIRNEFHVNQDSNCVDGWVFPLYTNIGIIVIFLRSFFGYWCRCFPLHRKWSSFSVEWADCQNCEILPMTWNRTVPQCHREKEICASIPSLIDWRWLKCIDEHCLVEEVVNCIPRTINGTAHMWRFNDYRRPMQRLVPPSSLCTKNGCLRWSIELLGVTERRCSSATGRALMVNEHPRHL